MKVSSIIKKMKQRSFAAAVSRDDIREGAVLLGLELSEHVENCIQALQGVASELGLEPDEAT